MENCLFCKINHRKIPAKIIYEDDSIIAFNDINPKAQIHFLVIPKQHIPSMLELDDSHKEIIAHLILKAKQLALENGLNKGYKTHINTGQNGGQEVDHLHIHIYGNKD